MRYILVAVAILLLAGVALGVYAWRRPLAVFNAMNRRALKSGGFTRIQVQTPVGVETAWEAGSGPALVLLHGAGDQAGTWAKVAPEMKAQYHVIALDLAGHGESEPRTGPISLKAMLTGVESVIERCGGAQPVTIVGNSLGAWMAMLYAQKHPQRVARVVLVNGGAIMGHRPDLAFMPKNREEARKLFDNIMDRGSPKPPGFILDDVVRESQRGPLARLMMAVDEWPAFLMDDKLAQVTTPVDLLWGTADQIFSLDYAHRMQAQLPAVRLTEIPRCGHIPQQECPLTFTAKLKEVLAQPAPVPATPPAAKP
jgi:pimeloyl-ACP methyl ester carboxylesterase